jgi:hypothetical protein
MRRAVLGSVFRVLVGIAVIAGGSFAQTSAFGHPRLPSLAVTGVPQPPNIEFGDGYGGSLCSPGDINGDGVDDLIVGAPLAVENGLYTNGRIEAVDGATGGVIWAFTGTVPSQGLGSSLAVFPDFDGDLIADFVTTTTIAGRFHVRIYSSVSGPGGSTPSLLADVDAGSFNPPFFGIRITAAYPYRDTTGDGIPEVVVIGFPPPSIVPPQVGGDLIIDMVTGTIVATLPEPESSPFRFGAHGRAIVTDADLTGDGIPDLVIGRPAQGRNVLPYFPAGKVAAFDGVTFQPLWTTFGVAEYEQLGTSLLNVGDVNGDAVPDIVAGAAQVNPFAGYHYSGSIWLIDGATGMTLQVFQPLGPSMPPGIERFGTSLALLPAGPGYEDFGRLVVGCGSRAPTPGQLATVAVRLNVGSTGITPPLMGGLFVFQADGALVGPDNGGIVEIAQLNGDSSKDIVIGVSRGGSPSPKSGSVQIYRMQGAAPFGSGPPSTHTLTISSSIFHLIQALSVAGGTPGNVCFLGGSLARASAPLPVAGGQVLIDVFDPSFVLLPSPVPFDALGTAFFDLYPAYALPVNGRTWFAQALELSPAAPQGAFFSDGIELTF